MAFYHAESFREVGLLEDAIRRREVVMAPPVVAELLSNPFLAEHDREDILAIPALALTAGFWARSGLLRASLIRRGHHPKLADTLIAQTCIDHKVPLLTRDRDFRLFARHGGLKLI